MSQYGENDARPLIGQLFSGGLAPEEAIERLRTRLLDLTARNPLLNFKHPKNKCIQIIDGPFIDLVFNRLYDETKQVSINYIPEPSPLEYEGKKPDVKNYAETIGIDISTEFEPYNYDIKGHQLNGLQALYYPEDLEKLLGKISRDAKTAIEETGSNVLFMIFGFLQFYESEDSDRPLISPLLSIPVSLNKGKVDPQTGTYQYTVMHNGEDLAENQTLREKLNKDFRLVLPELEEDETPEDYFEKVEEIVSKKKRWKVKRQLTLGLLSFGKLAIWAGLDTKKNPYLAKHKLIKNIFSGNGGNSSLSFSEDYDVDKHPKGDLQFIFDADSSQHSAIIDVLAGKNIVINGPPGTGKSQTITNIIANAVSSGKKVLFVSEKMAALEVVRRRLTMAGLGNFCLELHSHKTQKKQLLEDIDARIKSRFPAPPLLEEKLSTLKKQKEKLSRYAQLMGSIVGNKMGLTINEIFWATEKNRQELEDYINVISHVEYTNAHTWNHDDWNEFVSSLEDIASIYSEIKVYDKSHPWWGLTPNSLYPNDVQRILKIVEDALVDINSSITGMKNFNQLLGEIDEKEIEYYEDIYSNLDSIEDIQIIEQLLSKFFKINDNKFNIFELKKDVDNFSNQLKAAIDLNKCLEDMHGGMPFIQDFDLMTLRDKKNIFNKAEILSFKLTDLASTQRSAKEILNDLIDFILERNLKLINFSDLDWDGVGNSLSYINTLNIPDQKFLELYLDIDAVKLNLMKIKLSNEKLKIFAGNNLIKYDGSSAAIDRLANKSIFAPLLVKESIAEDKIEHLRELIKNPHASRSLRSIDSLIDTTQVEIVEINNLIIDLKRISISLNHAFPFTYSGLQELVSIAIIANSAPIDLLPYRHKIYSTQKVKSSLQDFKKIIQIYEDAKIEINQLFFIDATPDVKDLKEAVNLLRSKDGLFAFFDSKWRKSKNIHLSLAKASSSISAKSRADELSKLIKFLEFENLYFDNSEFPQIFGELFRGLNTNVSDISRLISWYELVGEEYIKSPWISKNIDINTLSEKDIQSLSNSKNLIELNVNSTKIRLNKLKEVSSPAFFSMANFLHKDIETLLKDLNAEIAELKLVASEFHSLCVSDVAPSYAFELLKLQREITPYVNEISTVDDFVKNFTKSLPQNFEFLKLNLSEDIERNCDQFLNQLDLLKRNLISCNIFDDTECCISICQDFHDKFINTKDTLACVGLDILKINFNDWSHFNSTVREFLNDWEIVLDVSNKYLSSDKTASDLIVIIDKYQEYKNINNTLSNSQFVANELSNIYQGLNTPLELVQQTFEWGQSVFKLSIPTNLKRSILSENSLNELGKFRQILRQIIDGTNDAKEKINELSEFGGFDWDKWLSSINSSNEAASSKEIEKRLLICKENIVGVLPWAKYIAARENIITLGLIDFLMALEGKQIPPINLSKAFEFSAFQSIGKRIYEDYPELLKFNSRNHERVREEFQKLDSEIIKLNGKSFANLIHKCSDVPQGSVGVRVGEYTELNLLKHEINKQRKHIPIRKLLSRAGNALLELKPIFMMGPMSVAQYLEGDNLSFDLVVMDEASQLRPEEAIGAIAKAKQLVVVGDPKQLPPTNFFDKLTESPDEENDDDAPAVITGMESILDICQQLFTPTRSLRWHYRSQHESLIAFSNFHFYKNLIVFPSPFSKSPELGVKYRFLPKGIYKDRQNMPEAQAVVDAVINHMIKSPHESLGVVTLNQTQRELIEELLDQKFKTFSETSSFKANWEKEGWPFFVKNLENVQGDERDVIYISTTFGKAPGTTKPKQNFGPISRPDGWRRLNVLFTRSRKRIELFTSMSAEDIVVDEKTPLGTKALKDYLDFARRGVLVSTDEGIREPDSDFEVAVANVISNWGYEVRPQLGVAGFFIDLVVRNPRRPGEYLAAIECDGATYHSGCSVRDRDRIRQEILESLGWKNKIYRIWSTDWFYNPLESIGKLKSFLDSCQRKADSELIQSTIEVDHYLEIDADPELSHSSGQTPKDHSVLSLFDVADDIFVEVGDRVTYVSSQSPSERHTVTITDSLSNPNLNFINEKTPLATAILGLSVGEVGELEVSSAKGKQINEIRILKIEK